MAVVKLSSLVTGIQGKLNGSQFSVSGAGLMLQNKCQQRVNGSALQYQWRQQFKFAANYWKTLSASEQEANNAAALNYPYIDRFGDTRYYNGYQLLLRSNANRSAIGLVPIATVPSTPPLYAPLDPLEVFMYFASGVFPVVEVNFNVPQTLPSSDIVQFFVSPAVSVGISNYNGNYLFAGYQTVGSEQILFEGSNVPYVNTWSVGAKVFWRVRVINPSSGVEVFYFQSSSIIYTT